MYSDNCSSTLTDCTFTGNSSNSDGGGMYCNNSNATLVSCLFDDNFSMHDGGAMALFDTATDSNGNIAGHVSLTNCEFTGNISASSGGAIVLVRGYQMALNASGCIFIGNSAMSMDFSSNYGGAIATIDGNASFTGCKFEDNSAGYGGAFYTESTANGTNGVNTLSNCRVARNIGKICGGASFNYYGTVYSADTYYCGNIPDHLVGGFVSQGGNEMADACEPDTPGVCTGDTNTDYSVDVLDLLYVIAVWSTDNPAGDINGDGWVNVMDLLDVIANWGNCDS